MSNDDGYQKEATEIAASLSFYASIPSDEFNEIVEVITDGLRQAEKRGIERAAKVANDKDDIWEEISAQKDVNKEWALGFKSACQLIAKEVTALKLPAKEASK